MGVPGTAGAGEHSVVSFSPAPTTRQAPLLLAAPVGMPVTLLGTHYLPDPAFGCTFGGGAARLMMGEFVSSAVFKCEVPDRGGGGGGPESWWYGHSFPQSMRIVNQCTRTPVGPSRGGTAAHPV